MYWRTRLYDDVPCCAVLCHVPCCVMLCAMMTQQGKLDVDQVLSGIAAAGLTDSNIGDDLAEALW